MAVQLKVDKHEVKVKTNDVKIEPHDLVETSPDKLGSTSQTNQPSQTNQIKTSKQPENLVIPVSSLHSLIFGLLFGSVSNFSSALIISLSLLFVSNAPLPTPLALYLQTDTTYGMIGKIVNSMFSNTLDIINKISEITREKQHTSKQKVAK